MEQESHSAGKAPILCSNNCGFFGSPATNNLCSKCYKDVFLSKAKAAVEAVAAITAGGDVDVDVDVDVDGDGEGDGDGAEAEAEASSAGGKLVPVKKPAYRCSFCNKRVGLMGFKCKCGEVYCSIHRYSDKHGCSFDYKGEGQDAIAKANPIVKPHKVERI